MYIDHKANVWIAGAQTRPGENGSGPDGMVLKFSANGKFLLQIGGRGPSKGSVDTTQLGAPAAVAVDPQTNEVFIADGYSNRRVIVFDADSGAFKRQWGAYGDPRCNRPSAMGRQGGARIAAGAADEAASTWSPQIAYHRDSI